MQEIFSADLIDVRKYTAIVNILISYLLIYNKNKFKKKINLVEWLRKPSTQPEGIVNVTYNISSIIYLHTNTYTYTLIYMNK